MDSKKILWIEDDTDIIGDIVFPLEKEGFKIDILASLAAFKKKKKSIGDYCFAIVDLIIPQQDRRKVSLEHAGLEVLRIIRNDINSDIPIIVLTVVQSEKIIGEVNQYNVASILHKPIRAQVLCDAVLRNLKP